MKRIIIALFFIVIVCQMHAQLNNLFVFNPSSNQELIEDAVKDGIYIIKQSYQIKENATGRMFGVDGKNEFGSSYSLAVKSTMGFYIYDVAARPWIYDNSFKQLEQNKYSPVLSSTSIYKIDSKGDFEAVQTGTIVSLNEELVYRIDVQKPDSVGFSLLKTKGVLTGWVVLLTTEKDSKLADKPLFDYSIYRREITIGDDLTVSFEAAQETKTVIGGFFVVPENTGIGQITFRLAGLIQETEGKWIIALINETNITPSNLSTDASSADSERKLTPVSEEDNKNSSEDKPSKRKNRKNKTK